MAKLTPYLKISGILILLFSASAATFGQYRLSIRGVDKDSLFIHQELRLKTTFTTSQHCVQYINQLPELLQKKGYPNASIDTVKYDSTAAHCELYVGDASKYSYISTDSLEPSLLSQSGLHRFARKVVPLSQLDPVRQKLLDHLENSGYPFAAVSLDNVRFEQDTLFALLKVEKGPLYRVDSIRNLGSASISSGFLQQYLGIRNGTTYRKEKLAGVSSRLRELPFLRETQSWNMSLLGTGSVLNLYLEPKKSSEVNVLVGLLPANEQLASKKMLVTGEANINLKNALGGGENIGLNWQQIQVKSPRLNILFQQPYLFGSPFGVNFNFDLFKKDSSFVNVGILIGASYAVSSTQTGSVFLQRLTTNLLHVDTVAVKTRRRLPSEADVSSVNIGVTYDWNTTDYRFNPRRGNEFSITASTGTKNIRKNNVIVKLFDGNEPEYDFNRLYDTFRLSSYQFRVRMKMARYFPVTRASSVKAAVQGGWFQSPSIFRNELFQVGGYKTLRGFDEESIFSSMFGVFTTEYRYLVGQNSFLSAFVDYGLSRNKALAGSKTEGFLGTGLGMAFETKAGIFNITYAVGKRDDSKFNLRQSKIHLGYVNYF